MHRLLTATGFAGLALATACASTPNVTLAVVDPTVVVNDQASPAELGVSSQDQTMPDPLAPSSPSPDPAASAAPPTTQPLLAGGVDPATLQTTPAGGIAVQPTPAQLIDRQLPSPSALPPPSTDSFTFDIQLLEGEPLRRSTWRNACPVEPDELRYVTVSFWGFDGNHHTGELIVAAREAEGVVSVFHQLHDLRFPIEEMRIVTPIDVVARQTGDGNNTASFVCRLVTGGTRFSEHAFGLAIDINPFHNPYRRGEVVIPSLASAYLTRDQVLPGMIVPGDPSSDVVISAFAEIGWSWGGDWTSLKDYQHFSKNNR